jgi:hypothetical protein
MLQAIGHIIVMRIDNNPHAPFHLQRNNKINDRFSGF